MESHVNLGPYIAVAEGRWNALFAIAGMLAGADVYAEAYAYLEKSLLTVGSFGKLTLPGVLGMSAWAVIPILGVVFFEKKGL